MSLEFFGNSRARPVVPPAESPQKMVTWENIKNRYGITQRRSAADFFTKTPMGEHARDFWRKVGREDVRKLGKSLETLDIEAIREAMETATSATEVVDLFEGAAKDGVLTKSELDAANESLAKNVFNRIMQEPNTAVMNAVRLSRIVLGLEYSDLWKFLKKKAEAGSVEALEELARYEFEHLTTMRENDSLRGFEENRLHELEVVQHRLERALRVLEQRFEGDYRSGATEDQLTQREDLEELLQIVRGMHEGLQRSRHDPGRAKEYANRAAVMMKGVNLDPRKLTQAPMELSKAIYDLEFALRILHATPDGERGRSYDIYARELERLSFLKENLYHHPLLSLNTAKRELEEYQMLNSWSMQRAYNIGPLNAAMRLVNHLERAQSLLNEARRKKTFMTTDPEEEKATRKLDAEISERLKKLEPELVKLRQRVERLQAETDV